MDDLLHKYTAGELLKWLSNTPIDDYIIPVAEEDDEGNSFAVSMIDADKVETDFMREVRRYEVVKRGYTLFIHDNKICQDILSWSFTDSDYEYVQNTANLTCESLNNRSMRFIANRDKCW